MGATWVPYCRLVELVGETEAEKIIQARLLFIPNKPSARMLEVMSVGSALTLCKEYGGGDILFASSTIRKRDKERIIELLEEGLSQSQIMIEVGCSLRHVQSVASSIGMVTKRSLKKRQKIPGQLALPMCCV